MSYRIAPPDGSRDPRIEDPTNLWFIHPASRLLLPAALRLGISANLVSICGLVLGSAAAWSFYHWPDRWLATAGFLLCIGWMIADGLDGMVARATRTASPLGRVLDGVCDHGVFVLLYLALAFSIGTAGGWALACAAGAVHGIQASLYEGERMRFHRRIQGRPAAVKQPSSNAVVRSYDALSGSLDRLAFAFETYLAHATDPRMVGERYGRAATPPMRLLALLTNNVRVIAVYIACRIGDPRLFWWFELVPLTIVAAIGMTWHRHVETRLAKGCAV